MTRREFLSYSAMAGVVGAIGVSPILSACAGGKKKNAYEPLRAEGEYYVPDLPDKAVAGRELKAGVIGCGGRGSGAAENFLAAADGVTITAIGDVFPDRVQSLKQMLHDKYQVDLADENCFTGFDAFNWFFGYKQPISATAFGSRQRRVTGDQYDNFSVDFEYENGVHVHSMSRQIDGCDTNISEFIHGTKGTWESGPMVSGACVIKDLDGNVLWSY